MDDLQVELDTLERVICRQKEPGSVDFQLLRRLTGNFSDGRRIGEGGCGKVYKGILPNGVVIAVKKLKNSHTVDEKMFLREVDSMIKVGHENIVTFLGYCSDTKGKALQMDGGTVMAEERERLLCFEYLEKGSLDNYLTDELRGFEWHTRYQIIKGICYGLLHLHKEKRILHMDLKPANILLSGQMVPKITDFGLSRSEAISQTTSAQRLISPGYCAPEYIESGKRSWKSDIYSLGVIIIELVTGSRQHMPNVTKVLRRWRHRWSKSSNHIPLWYQQVKKCLELAVSCKEKNPINRPFIWGVVDELNKLDSWDGQIRESSIKKIISSSDDMLGIQPLELHFTLAHDKKQMSCSIELINDTDYYMAFKIATTSVLKFSIRPCIGIAEPRSKSITASITLSEQEMIPLHLHNLCEEEFIVQSTRIDASLTHVDITDTMFNDEGGNSQKKIDDGDKVVDQVNLTVLFEEHQKDVANLSAEMGSLGTSTQVQQTFMLSNPYWSLMELPDNKLTDFIKSSEKAKWIQVNNHNVKNFTEDEIKSITNNYSTPIGQGGSGQVYRGSLDDGTTVAVKKYTFQTLKDGFAKELIVHYQINHKNVVRLLGYCSEDHALMIVTEYVPGRNLKDLLHGSDAPIPLDARLRIAIECADALGYMHSSMYRPIIHGNIKPDNILLDNNLSAKLSDFGLSRLLSMDQTEYTMHVEGSRGYVDPEYIETGLVDPKSDVYSFGVVLLELITRAKASENGFSTDLKRMFTDALGKGKQEARKLFDTDIANERDIEIVDEIGNLAAKCLTKDIKERPEMKEVLGSLHILRGSLRCEKAQEKIGQQSSLGMQATQTVDDHGSSVPSSSFISKVIYKLSNLNIFNKKSRKFQSNGGLVLKQVCDGITIFTLEQMKIITHNYSTVTTQDHTGFVYKGHIDGQVVAVKRSVRGDRTFDKDFVDTMVFACTLRHMNIFNLVGCCLETEDPLLVFDFAANGSLHDLLHCYNGNLSLSLDLRLGIAIGSAEALRYLHYNRKVHGNITSTCIMLDHNLLPKVDIFCGLLISSKAYVQLEHNNLVYIDPVYLQSGLLTSKGDVYSFGIVLLELITRKQQRNVDENFSLPVEYIKAFKNENSGKAMFDEEIAVEGNIFILEKMGMLAADCLRYDMDERPEMVHVVERLKMLIRY